MPKDTLNYSQIDAAQELYKFSYILQEAVELKRKCVPCNKKASENGLSQVDEIYKNTNQSEDDYIKHLDNLFALREKCVILLNNFDKVKTEFELLLKNTEDRISELVQRKS